MQYVYSDMYMYHFVLKVRLFILHSKDALKLDILDIYNFKYECYYINSCKKYMVMKFFAGILDKVIKLFKKAEESKKPLEVAKQCIHPGASKKDINRYLHHLRNAGFLSLTYHKGTNADPRYSALPEIRKISGIHF